MRLHFLLILLLKYAAAGLWLWEASIKDLAVFPFLKSKIITISSSSSNAVVFHWELDLESVVVSSFPPYVIWRKGGGRGALEDCEGAAVLVGLGMKSN